MGDSGYKNAEFPELYAGWEANTTLNRRRLVVENYFGRMAKVFGVVKEKFSLGYEHVNNYIKALCFLTNVSVCLKPLRHKDYLVHCAIMNYIASREEEKRKAHREVVRRSRETARTEQQSSQNTNVSPMFSSLASLDTPPSKRSPFDDAFK